MIYLFSNHNSPRLQYTVEVCFNLLLGMDCEVTTDEAFFNSIQDSPKINYSDQALSNSIWIKPHALLFETNIQPQKIAVTHLDGIPYFFKTSEQTDILYDLLASTFYMISRFEEYLPFTPDTHGRFSAKESLAYKANFLHLPVVHFWMQQLKNLIINRYPSAVFPTQTFSQINTIDIDVAYAYKGKPFFRQCGGLIKSLLQFNQWDLTQRCKYYLGGKDVFDTYNYLEQVLSVSKTANVFFFELGKYGTFDKNLPLNQTLKNLIIRLSKIGDIGIHPSYLSNTETQELTREIQALENVLGHKVAQSRQHYLKLEFPMTYENLISNGIATDYSMGFADHIGFRAGISVAYPFFNLETNEKRPLQILPFQLMEGTLKDYQNLTLEEAVQMGLEMRQIVADVKGTFVSIFHNSSLSDSGEWKGWIQLFESLLKPL
jgi:hypothetical protein